MDTSEHSLSIAVFCGASDGHSPRYAATADDLGTRIAAGGHRLVYGAGGVGTMGAVARAAATGGAPILGVIPEFLRTREMGDDLPPQDIVLTADLLERKRVMIDSADAFIALPGGYGTLDEILEVVSMAALGQHVGPLVLVDVDCDWDPLLRVVDGLLQRGFIRDAGLIRIAADPREALDMVVRGRADAMAGASNARV
ncbi:TIGR00730 family Rossman fold protein [Streptomyces sp. ok210]|jgi:uncharacterized protein (TIGR00730 family)|uniref:LOG family protein n=1 Tax=Streptomyces sp. ok210 TaxID=1761905 RepID=UPI0008F044DA|nr:TIGR00730 family Rossman fold protein [Streptomyces sp. ok210]SFT31403.1 hypothetical protein SAMN04487982_11939 [Streptomyces sp. ok210]